jgi:hypothetical protein
MTILLQLCFLELGRKGGGGPDLTLDLELRVKSGGTWGILEDRDLRLWPIM